MTFLLHKTFEKQSKELKVRKPKIEGALTTALQEIMADPIPGALQGVGKPLQGIIHKKHVGGRKGHRLLYLYFKNSNYIIPVYISPEPKPPFDYNQIDWEEICREFFEDFTKKNYGAFSNWKR